MKIPPRIGFIGLGIMGKAMALNLIKNGYKVSVYNRDRKKTEEFEKLNCTVCSTPKELTKISNIIITMVENDKAVNDVLEGPEGVFKGNSGGNYLINMSTVSLNFTKKIKERTEQENMFFLDCPVSGSKPLAENATLILLCGAKKEHLEKMRPILLSMGKDIVHPGEAPLGTALKLCMNLIVAQMTTAICESTILSEKLNLNPKFIFETIYNSPALNCGYYKMKEKNILEKDFTPSFSVKNILKDINYMIEAAKNKDTILPMTNTAKEVFENSFKNGFYNEDLTAICKTINKNDK